MVINHTALIIGAVTGFLIAVLVSLWEDKMAKDNMNGIVTISILGGIALTCIVFFAIGEIAPNNNMSDILRNVIFAALLTFLPFRRVKILKNIVLGSANKTKVDDEHKDD